MDGNEDDGMMDESSENPISKAGPVPIWTIEQERLYIKLLMGLVFDYDNYQQFERECMSLEKKREVYSMHRFGGDWALHAEHLEELGIPLHLKTQIISKYWYDVGFMAGYNFANPIKDDSMPPETSLEDEPPNEDG